MRDLDDLLDRLAPEVDLAASRELFDARRVARAREPGRHRALLVAAAVLVLVVTGVAVVVASSDRDTTLRTLDGVEQGEVEQDGVDSTAPSTAATGPIAFEVLAMDRATLPMGTLDAATDEETLTELWDATRFTGGRPDVDLSQRVVVSITIPDDACPPELTGFDQAGDTLIPVFVEPPGGCIQPLSPKTYVVAIDRARVQPRFQLFLPGQPTFDYVDQFRIVDVPPAG